MRLGIRSALQAIRQQSMVSAGLATNLMLSYFIYSAPLTHDAASIRFQRSIYHKLLLMYTERAHTGLGTHAHVTTQFVAP